MNEQATPQVGATENTVLSAFRLILVMLCILIMTTALHSTYAALRLPTAGTSVNETILALAAVLLLSSQFIFWTAIMTGAHTNRESPYGFAAFLAHIYALVIHAALLYWLATLLSGHESGIATVMVALLLFRCLHLLMTKLQGRYATEISISRCAIIDILLAVALAAALLLRENVPFLGRISPRGCAALVGFTDAVLVYLVILGVLKPRKISQREVSIREV